MKSVLLYTMTSGLGDYIVMGDLIKKIESLSKTTKCFIVHRRNPHINLWPFDEPGERFFDVYNPFQILKMISKLRRYKKNGYTIFGLQMAPGSVQGFLFYLFLKKIKSLDFIVDFNLINADIITPPKGNYILDLHLNQVQDLLRIAIPKDFYMVNLPIKFKSLTDDISENSSTNIGIHPWSRRGHLSCFVWPYKNWVELINFLLSEKNNKIIIFGKDDRFEDFKRFIKQKLTEHSDRIKFKYSNSVLELIKEIQLMDLLISVNTSVVHIGYALKKRMIILCGPSLDIWTPKSNDIKIVRDDEAEFQSADKSIKDDRFGSVDRIDVNKIISILKISRND